MMKMIALKNKFVPAVYNGVKMSSLLRDALVQNNRAINVLWCPRYFF